jgi:hypothetical protein
MSIYVEVHTESLDEDEVPYVPAGRAHIVQYTDSGKNVIELNREDAIELMQDLLQILDSLQ